MSPFLQKMLAVLALVMLLTCAGGAWLVEAFAHLSFGWVLNLRDVLPRVTVNPAGVALFFVALPLAAWLTHSTCGWLWQSTRTPPALAWRWKWTLVGLAGVMLMFVAGVAATGVVHQTGWLIRSPMPLLAMRYRPKVLQIKCSSNLRQIGLAIKIYTETGGHWPTSRAELARMAPSLDLVADVFVCPASLHDRAPGTQPAEWAAHLDDDRYFSYVVSPRPLPSPDGEGRVMLYEPLDQHGDGMNLLYEDGHVDWLDRPTAERWLAMIDAELKAAPATKPTE